MEDSNNNNNENINNPTSTTTTTTNTTIKQEQPKPTSGWGFSSWGFSNIIETVSNQVSNIQQINIMETVQQINTGLVETIKSKSDQMVNVFGEDLKEFSNSIMSDTSQILQSQYDNVKQYIPDSITNAMEDLKNGTAAAATTTTTINNDNNSNNNVNTPIKSPSNYLAKSLSFFTSDPTDILEFEHWCVDFGDLDSHSFEINTLLSVDEGVKKLYNSYVPSKISHQQFWLKYFYKQYKTQKEEEKRQLILQQVTQEEEEQVGWDDSEEEEKEEEVENDISLSKLDINNNSNNNEDSDFNNSNSIEVNNLKQAQVLENTQQNLEPEKDEEELIDLEIERKYLEEQRLLEIERQQKKLNNSQNSTPQKQQQQQLLVDDSIIDNDNIENNDKLDSTPLKANNNNNNATTINTPNKNINLINNEDDEEDFGWDD